MAPEDREWRHVILRYGNECWPLGMKKLSAAMLFLLLSVPRLPARQARARLQSFLMYKNCARKLTLKKRHLIASKSHWQGINFFWHVYRETCHEYKRLDLEKYISTWKIAILLFCHIPRSIHVRDLPIFQFYRSCLTSRINLFDFININKDSRLINSNILQRSKISVL